MGTSVATDGSGNVYTTGEFEDTVDFDPGTAVDNHTSNGNTDIYLSKLDSNGNSIWSRTWGGIGDDIGTSVAIDNFDNVYITGMFADTVDFDPGPGRITTHQTARYMPSSANSIQSEILLGRALGEASLKPHVPQSQSMSRKCNCNRHFLWHRGF